MPPRLRKRYCEAPARRETLLEQSVDWPAREGRSTRPVRPKINGPRLPAKTSSRSASHCNTGRNTCARSMQFASMSFRTFSCVRARSHCPSMLNNWKSKTRGAASPPAPSHVVLRDRQSLVKLTRFDVFLDAHVKLLEQAPSDRLIDPENFTQDSNCQG